jgi:hypothetical protein
MDTVAGSGGDGGGAAAWEAGAAARWASILAGRGTDSLHHDGVSYSLLAKTPRRRAVDMFQTDMCMRRMVCPRPDDASSLSWVVIANYCAPPAASKKQPHLRSLMFSHVRIPPVLKAMDAARHRTPISLAAQKALSSATVRANVATRLFDPFVSAERLRDTPDPVDESELRELIHSIASDPSIDRCVRLFQMAMDKRKGASETMSESMMRSVSSTSEDSSMLPLVSKYADMMGSTMLEAEAICFWDHGKSAAMTIHREQRNAICAIAWIVASIAIRDAGCELLALCSGIQGAMKHIVSTISTLDCGIGRDVQLKNPYSPIYVASAIFLDSLVESKHPLAPVVMLLACAFLGFAEGVCESIERSNFAGNTIETFRQDMSPDTLRVFSVFSAEALRALDAGAVGPADIVASIAGWSESTGNTSAAALPIYMSDILLTGPSRHFHITANEEFAFEEMLRRVGSYRARTD